MVMHNFVHLHQETGKLGREVTLKAFWRSQRFLHIEWELPKVMAFVTDDTEQVSDTAEIVFAITTSIIQQL
jgi:hypothetical protein